MVDGLDLLQGATVLDVAAGTGSISRLLRSRGFRVVSLDQSPQMARLAANDGAAVVLATAERLPFKNATFNGVTFGYLLRYVDDVKGCVEELTRVVQPGGVVAMVEFSRPRGVWYPPWWVFTRMFLPLSGALIGSGWRYVGQFLGPSIDAFYHQNPPDRLVAIWAEAGLCDVQYRRMSLGGGLVMWGRRG